MPQIDRRSLLAASATGMIAMGGSVFLTACGPAGQSDSSSSASSGTSEGGDTLGDGTTLRVGMEAEYPPYNWQETSASDTTIPIENVDNAYADGYDVAIAKKIAAAFGEEAVAVKMSFDGLIDSLNNGQIDIICAGMSETPERAQSVDFSKSYLDDGVALLVAKDGAYASATSLEDFKGTAVVGQKATLYDDVIDQIPEVNHLTPLASVPNVIETLNKGAADAATMSSLSAPGVLSTYTNLKMVEFAEGKGFTDAENPDNAAIKKGQDGALAKINEVIEGLSSDEQTSLWEDAMNRQPATA